MKYNALVIGEDPEAVLAPYDENLKMEPYPAEGAADRSTTLERARRSTLMKGLEDLTDEEVLIRWCGLDVAFDEQGRRLTTANPRPKWDQWRMGDGHLFDRNLQEWRFQARRGALGFEEMARRSVEEGQRKWDEYTRLTKGLAPMTVTWEQHLEKYLTEDRPTNKSVQIALDDLSKTHGAWLWVVKKLSPLADPVVEWCTNYEEPEMAYLHRAALRTWNYAAVVTEDDWFEGADLSHYETELENEVEWLESVRGLVVGLPDDALVTGVGCRL